VVSSQPTGKGKEERVRILSVNVSTGRDITYMGKTVRTGIFKEPVTGRVRLRELNLDGDAQSDLVAHGGIYKAAYVYSVENYEFWKRELDRTDFTFGQFGENLTVDDMLEDRIHIGDVFRVGSAVVEVTQPRVPCYKLGIKMQLPAFPKMFLASNRAGFYLRVVQEGAVGAGDAFELVAAGPEQMSVRDVNHLLYFDPKNFDGARRALRIQALSPGWGGSFEERLAREGAPIEYRDGSGTRENVAGLDRVPERARSRLRRDS
jgi:MOSC domain-containing protein YiiM